MTKPKIKTLKNTDSKDAKKNVSDIQFWGNPDTFKLISKAWSEKEGWMKSTKAMETECGCVVQVSTQQKNQDGTYAISEALTFVPDVYIAEEHTADGTCTGRMLLTWAYEPTLVERIKLFFKK